MRAILLAFLVVAVPGWAAEKPAALQLCVQLPEGVPLFSSGPALHYRALGGGVWMLDFDVVINGHGVDRVTKSAPDCIRVWMQAEKVRAAGFDFSRLALNLVNVSVPLSVQLKPDLWSDGGSVAVARAPWATAQNKTDGTMTLERGGVEVKDWNALPTGTYAVKFTPKPLPQHDCSVALKVEGIGTVRPGRNEVLYKEMVEYYRSEFLPQVIKEQHLQCDPFESAQVNVKLIDGIWANPFRPAITRVRDTEKEPKYLITVDGKDTPYADGVSITLEPGQQVELREADLRAEL